MYNTTIAADANDDDDEVLNLFHHFTLSFLEASIFVSKVTQVHTIHTACPPFFPPPSALDQLLQINTTVRTPL